MIAGINIIMVAGCVTIIAVMAYLIRWTVIEKRLVKARAAKSAIEDGHKSYLDYDYINQMEEEMGLPLTDNPKPKAAQRPSAVLEVKGVQSVDSMKKLRESLEKEFNDSAKKIMHLTEGMSVQDIPFGCFPYRVRSGESMYHIARSLDLNVKDILRHNDLNPPYKLDPGQVIFVPTCKSKDFYWSTKGQVEQMRSRIKYNEDGIPYMSEDLDPSCDDCRWENLTTADGGIVRSVRTEACLRHQPPKQMPFHLQL